MVAINKVGRAPTRCKAELSPPLDTSQWQIWRSPSAAGRGRSCRKSFRCLWLEEQWGSGSFWGLEENLEGGSRNQHALGDAWCLWSFAFLGQVTQRPAGWARSDVWCSIPLPGAPCSCWLASAVGTLRLLPVSFLFSAESLGDAKAKHVNANAHT